jgi:hypothetical protein
MQAEGEHVTRPRARRFAGAPTQGASVYHVELFRRDVRIFAASVYHVELFRRDVRIFAATTK